MVKEGVCKDNIMTEFYDIFWVYLFAISFAVLTLNYSTFNIFKVKILKLKC